MDSYKHYIVYPISSSGLWNYIVITDNILVGTSDIEYETVENGM